jgi:hypothetical protein
MGWIGASSKLQGGRIEVGEAIKHEPPGHLFTRSEGAPPLTLATTLQIHFSIQDEFELKLTNNNSSAAQSMFMALSETV